MKQKIDLAYKAGCAVASHQCPYKRLLCPFPLLSGKRSACHGNRCSNEGWHIPKTRLCSIPNIAIFRLSLGGAKLNSRKTRSEDMSNSFKKPLCALSNRSSSEEAAWKIAPAFVSNKLHIWGLNWLINCGVS